MMLDTYQRDGFVYPLQVVSLQQAADWRADLESLEAEYRTADLPHPMQMYRRTNSNIVIPLAAQIAEHPAILDAVEQVLGPDLLVWGCEFFIKEPRTKAIVSWHQDLTYWGLGATEKQCTAWLALSPATVDSGCMKFVAGSHKNPILPHRDTFAEDNLLSRGQEIAVDVDEADATAIELQPGQMSLHHGLMFHGSGPNVSDDRRIGIAIRYVTPEVAQEMADKDYAMLVRGCDRVGNFMNYKGAEQPFSPASLALWDEIKTEQMKALGAGAEQRLYSDMG